MQATVWQPLLVGALLVNAALGFGYRLYRFKKGGPLSDVIGQALLGALLVILALTIAAGAAWARWVAALYGLGFGLIVMPVWTLAVLIPLPPAGIDYAFTVVYWVALVVIVVAALAL